MSPNDLPTAYLFKVRTRMLALKVLLDAANYSDVVREAQEIVELCSKGLLRKGLMDPPHKHDVGQELLLVSSRPV